MKRLKLLFYAISPLIIGYLLNATITKFNWGGNEFFMVSILFFVYWFFAGYLSTQDAKSAIESVLIGNSFAMVSIILILIQSLILKSDLPNIIGTAPQMFYLPTLSLATKIEGVLLFFITPHTVWQICIFAFILMIAVYYAGYSAKLKKHKV